MCAPGCFDINSLILDNGDGGLGWNSASIFLPSVCSEYRLPHGRGSVRRSGSERGRGSVRGRSSEGKSGRGSLVILEFPVFHSIEKQVAGAFHAHIQIRYGIDLAITVEQPRQSEFGEMAVPAAFQLAKQLRQAPKKIAAELVEEIGSDRRRGGDGGGRQRLHQHPPGSRRVCGAAARRGRSAAKARARRSSSSTPTSIRTRRRTSGICATPRWATRSCACCARAAIRWRCRTTSTTPACRWPMWWWASTIWRTRRRPMCGRCWPTRRCGSITTAGICTRTRRATTRTIPSRWHGVSATLHAIESGEGEVAELAHLVADAIVEAHLRPCCGWAWSTTCCRARARFCTCSSGRRRSNC